MKHEALQNGGRSAMEHMRGVGTGGEHGPDFTIDERSGLAETGQAVSPPLKPASLREGPLINLEAIQDVRRDQLAKLRSLGDMMVSV